MGPGRTGEVYDRTPYTPRLREVIKLSKAEAGRLGHDYIGPEHFLLGIIRKGDGLAVQTLYNVQIDLTKLKIALEAMLTVGAEPPEPKEGIVTPNTEASQVLAAAKEIARRLKHNWIGTEHLFLGLIKEEGTIASRCLREAGLDYETTEQEALRVIDSPST
jgi:ATP-dependent Clp protease ATP-binding subunit ClpC